MIIYIRKNTGCYRKLQKTKLRWFVGWLKFRGDRPNYDTCRNNQWGVCYLPDRFVIPIKNVACDEKLSRIEARGLKIGKGS